MKESDLALKFIEYFSEGYEIFKEVPAGGIIDIYAMCGNISISVEVKVSLNFDVIEQAFKNKNYATFSYIGVPITKVRHFGYDICKRLGVGVLVYNDKDNMVTERIKAGINRRILKPKVSEFMKQSVAGSFNDRRTSFGESVKAIEQYLNHHGGTAHIKDVITYVDHHWSTDTTAKQCIRKWCEKGVIKTFTYEKGHLHIAPINKN